jgi:hypothetical protein
LRKSCNDLNALKPSAIEEILLLPVAMLAVRRSTNYRLPRSGGFKQTTPALAAAPEIERKSARNLQFGSPRQTLSPPPSVPQIVASIERERRERDVMWQQQPQSIDQNEVIADLGANMIAVLNSNVAEPKAEIISRGGIRHGASPAASRTSRDRALQAFASSARGRRLGQRR